MTKTGFLVVVVSLPLQTTSTRSDVGDDRIEDRLPGSRASLREAVQSSQTIVIVRDVEMGRPEMRNSSGKRSYGRVKLRVVKSLKGNAPEELFPVRVTLRTYPPNAVEMSPSQDSEYIFYIKGAAPEVAQGIKILRATEQTIADTKAVLQEVKQKPLGSQWK